MAEAKINAHAELENRIRFETLISNISARFVRLPSDEIDSEIERNLKQILDFFDVDRCGVLEVHEDKQSFHVTHACYAEGIEQVSKDINLAQLFPWAYEKLIVKGVPVRLNRMTELPPEAEQDRLSWSVMGVKSSLTIPLFCTQGVRYVLTIQSLINEHDWPKEFIPRLTLLGEIFINALGAEGTVGGPLGGSLAGNIDLSFNDVMDYLDLAAMGRMEAWKGKWGFTFDGIFMKLGASESFQGRRGVADFAMDADVRLGMADFGLAYRLWEQRFGKDNQQRLAFEPYGGLRYSYLKEKIDVNIDIADVGSRGVTLGTSEDWVEPFVGGRAVWDLNNKWSFNIRGDAGGFGIGSASDLTWQILGGVDYKISKSISLNAGYRYVELDYSHGSGVDELGIDLRAKGPFLGLTITF